MKNIILFAFILFSTQISAEQLIGNAELGARKIPSCQFCHGIEGEATSPAYPNLNGQNQGYLYSSMQSYRLGERQGDLSEMMKTQLSRLSQQDLADIAAYYAQFK